MSRSVVQCQTGIRTGDATDLWRTAIFDAGTPAHICFKCDIWRILGVKPDIAWRAVSDVVFSVTFFPVIVVGKMVQALLHHRKLSTGLVRSGKSRKKYQNLARSCSQGEPGDFFKSLKAGKVREKLRTHHSTSFQELYLFKRINVSH